MGRAYSLIAQIVDWGDRELEQLEQSGRIPPIRLPGRLSTSVDIGDADLSHFRLELTGRHNMGSTRAPPRSSTVVSYFAELVTTVRPGGAWPAA